MSGDIRESFTIRLDTISDILRVMITIADETNNPHLASRLRLLADQCDGLFMELDEIGVENHALIAPTESAA